MITFEVIKEREGGYVAACYDEKIFTDGETLAELHARITAAIEERFEGRLKPEPKDIKLMVWSE